MLTKPRPRQRYVASLIVGAGAFAISTMSAAALTPEERSQLDLSGYVVTDPMAGYFDVEARRRFLSTTTDPTLRAVSDELSMKVGCRDKLTLPILDYQIRLPGFYKDRAAWREAVQPLIAFEKAVSDLAGAYLATGDGFHADCLVTLLANSADAEALSDFHYSKEDRQAWFGVETSIFAAGLAYSVVAQYATQRPADAEKIKAWLSRIARKHIAFRGGKSSCCNNHFYRRALHAGIVGVVTGDDELFQFGVSALYSALHDLTEEGALPLEMMRGHRAVFYQNYALLHLIPIAEIVERQGYPAYELVVNGHSLRDAVAFGIDILEDATRLGGLAPHDQDLGALALVQGDQYYAWMEMYVHRFENARMERLIKDRRALFNRSAGGYVTLFFLDPRQDTL